MQDFLGQYYLVIKSLHIIAIISWMAGLLYLPRLFVYHVDAKDQASEMLKIMERRLLKFIMNPASIASWMFGGMMLYANPGLMSQPWMHAKLLCVVLMTGMHHGMMKWVKVFAADENTRSDKFYRIMNEVPTILMIAIVILAVAEPF
ncbi:MAG: TIGR00701 family protein [Alphaproteobacteria bacterium]|nr:TIGR00701 family protein [Alphaproteobacteria bacterium]HCQ70798.1 protoporphyrinogen oxidase HemJ [Rhodospirillaceae bacterium]|tara:strand:- start:18472 stop:18912 length:441 start_codon:yes stop_codon:yes gene_type:complete